MLSVQDIDKASRLIAERKRIASAEWNAVARVHDDKQRSGFTYAGGRPDADCHEKADEALAQAIEEFRQRKLTEIDGQLRDLGIDPATAVSERTATPTAGAARSEPAERHIVRVVS